MNYRKLGFTQQRPKLPGVYFVSAKMLRPGRFAPPRNAEGWDVAEVIFWAGSYTSVHENRESAAHWRIKCLDGLEYAWKPGMWMKGPISPDSTTPNAKLNGTPQACPLQRPVLRHKRTVECLRKW